MKYINTVLFLLLLSTSLVAQVPQNINFQGIARDGDGKALANTEMTIAINILDDAGTTEYAEEHVVTSDVGGLYTLGIGSGSVVSGNFDDITWGTTKSVSVSIDISSDNTTDIEFTSPLYSVPYALYARDVENKDDADADPNNEIQTLSLTGTTLSLSSGGAVTIPTGGSDADADPNNEIQQISIVGEQIFLSSGGSIILPTDDVNDADSDPNNEIQTLSLTGTTLSLSNGGAVTIPTGGSDADADPTNEIQELQLSNNLLSLSSGNTVDLTQYQVIIGNEASDVPGSPQAGQLYYDEVCNSLFMYNLGTWSEVPLKSGVTDIYDKDGDGIPNASDNCVDIFNPLQEDADNNGIGDACEENGGVIDTDNDGIIDTADNCPNDSNANQTDSDSDGLGDVCDDDRDGDGIANTSDNCPDDFNPGQEDLDSDGLGSVCDNDETVVTGLHPAFAEFSTSRYTIFLDGDEVVIETTGLPDHTSPYWSNTTERCTTDPMGNDLCTNENTTEDHPLFVAPTVTSFDQMAPGNIDDFNGSYTLRVPVSPQLANSSSATGLGAIGMATSGSMIYNDEEGPNVPLDNAIGSFDYTAAHTGPQSYHYHLEPKAWSDDDEVLIGIMSDGFFIYGRRNYDGTYPSDLDESGGHFGPTPHNASGEYHYHILNELYLNQYYILFPGDLQGTPNNIR